MGCFLLVDRLGSRCQFDGYNCIDRNLVRYPHFRQGRILSCVASSVSPTRGSAIHNNCNKNVVLRLQGSWFISRWSSTWIHMITPQGLRNPAHLSKNKSVRQESEDDAEKKPSGFLPHRSICGAECAFQRGPELQENMTNDRSTNLGPQSRSMFLDIISSMAST